jgi:hypothetical protein
MDKNYKVELRLTAVSMESKIFAVVTLSSM